MKSEKVHFQPVSRCCSHSWPWTQIWGPWPRGLNTKGVPDCWDTQTQRCFSASEKYLNRLQDDGMTLEKRVSFVKEMFSHLFFCDQNRDCGPRHHHCVS